MKKLKRSWGELSFQNFSKKESLDFSFHKNVGVGKIGGVVLFSLIFLLTNPFQCYFSLSAWWVCILFIYTISVSIICVSQGEPSFIASNQQIYDFYK